ncbi:MAG: protein phosphatase 2A regulatory subunit cdc55 [Watsoniomyces obsoletus]|nr:MAG: protein phosphatase 2A regulatory subunit cdc55 [Watsoniomyces obsoletus]
MATLNLSTNGPSISKSYQTVVQSSKPAGAAASSPTYGQWAIYSVSAPLVNAFQQDGAGKESVLKVQSTGEGELVDLIEDFSDGRIQFAFVKVKDPNSGLPKNVLIGWCGEGVPERTKGYFTSHLAAVSKVLHGAHVQITARSDRDLTPDGIIRKVSESSGANYSGGPATKPAGSAAPPPPLATKPAFNPTRSGGGASSFNPLAGRRAGGGPSNVDADGWGDDAPPVTRTQLEKVQPAYKPTKVNIKELASQKEEPSRFNASKNETSEQADVVKGSYQPVGKVDIAALRRQAKEKESKVDDRPTAVKGAYEPVGKVDIAAIRARAQPPAADRPSSGVSADQESSKPSVGSTNQSERLTSLPRPKVGSMSSSSSAFRGTKPPAPGGLGASAAPPAAAPVGAIGRTFADQGGKTPAQLWAEKKARERGMSGGGDAPSTSNTGAISPMASQKSGGAGGEWKSGYSGKSWAPVQTTKTGRSAGSGGEQDDKEQDEERPISSGGVGALRDRFKAPSPGQASSQPSPPPLDTSTKPKTSGGVALPGLPGRGIPQRDETEEEEERERAEDEQPHHRMPTPPAVPRSPTPPTPQPSSPIRVAMPVSRSKQPELEAPEERYSPPAIPAESTSNVVPAEEDLTDEPLAHDPARAAGEAAAVATFGAEAADHSTQMDNSGGKKALIQYDYEKAEGNEIDLVEGEYVTNIEMVDADWWMGQNSKGEMGLFPSNYVELVDDDNEGGNGGALQQEEQGQQEHEPPAVSAPTHQEADQGQEHEGASATALYDYEAAEPNELSFNEGAKITGIEFPDEDWWFGHHGGHEGLFPANYVQLDE